MTTYERKLSSDTEWALKEGSEHFNARSSVHDALRKISARLDDLGVPYAVVGAMAMFVHGYRRFTEDVDLLVTAEGLEVIHARLAGRGYVNLFAGSRSLRDTENGVRIEFIVTGDYPGDGKPKPVAFPDPQDASIEIGGIRYVNLVELVELKLASGMSSPGRLKDLADVQEMIRTLRLPDEFADRLHPSTHETYNQLWQAVQSQPAGE